MSSESTAAATPPTPSQNEPPEAGRRISKIRWSIHLALVAAVPLFAGFMGPAASAKSQGPALSNNSIGLLYSSFFEILFIAIPLALAWLASRASKDELLLRWRPAFWVLPLGALYSIVIRVVPGLLVGMCDLAAWIAGRSAEFESFMGAHLQKVENLVDINAMSNDPVYYGLVVVLVSMVLGGFREELWRSWFLAGLRALWPRAFSSTGGGIAAAAIAAVFFGIAHLPSGWVSAILISVVGFLLGVIMVVHRSIWPSVIAHGLFDALSTALLPAVAEFLKAKHGGG